MGDKMRPTMPSDDAIELAFDLALEHGRCVGIRIPADASGVEALIEKGLAPEERARAEAMPLPRRKTWAGGRAALREALVRVGIAPDAAARAVLPNDRGAPDLPAGISGSITHKETVAAALVAFEPHARVGVDLEIDASRSTDIASHVLTADELAAIAHLADDERSREVLVRFSAKEAVYKAIDPFVRRYVEFREVEVFPHADGSARFVSRLPPAEGPFAVEVRWRRFDGVILTTARVERAGASFRSGP
jgi:4'-phosphopantetheinyl transferase EntD